MMLDSWPCSSLDWNCHPLTVISSCFFLCYRVKMEFKIQTLWDGDSIDHDPVVIKLEGSPSGLIMTIDAPFFDDPKPLGGVAGQPYPELWNYEGTFFCAKFELASFFHINFYGN